MIKYKTNKPSPLLDPEMEIDKDLSTFNELMSVSIYLNVDSCYYELKNITTLKNFYYTNYLFFGKLWQMKFRCIVRITRNKKLLGFRLNQVERRYSLYRWPWWIRFDVAGPMLIYFPIADSQR